MKIETAAPTVKKRKKLVPIICLAMPHIFRMISSENVEHNMMNGFLKIAPEVY